MVKNPLILTTMTFQEYKISWFSPTLSHFLYFLNIFLIFFYIFYILIERGTLFAWLAKLGGSVEVLLEADRGPGRL